MYIPEVVETLLESGVPDVYGSLLVVDWLNSSAVCPARFRTGCACRALFRRMLNHVAGGWSAGAILE
jgi:hypothetical protein